MAEKVLIYSRSEGADAADRQDGTPLPGVVNGHDDGRGRPCGLLNKDELALGKTGKTR